MKVGILQVGQVAPEVLAGIAAGVSENFPRHHCYRNRRSLACSRNMRLIRNATNTTPALILNEVRAYAAKKPGFPSCFRLWLTLTFLLLG